jgi:hypothetical protein
MPRANCAARPNSLQRFGSGATCKRLAGAVQVLTCITPFFLEGKSNLGSNLGQKVLSVGPNFIGVHRSLR